MLTIAGPERTCVMASGKRREQATSMKACQGLNKEAEYALPGNQAVLGQNRFGLGRLQEGGLQKKTRSSN